MRKTAFEVNLRLPNYWSDGIIILSDTKEGNVKKVQGLFTKDKMIGEFDGENFDLGFLMIYFDVLGTIQFKGCQFQIKIGELYVPKVYQFIYNNEVCYIEFISQIIDTSVIEQIEEHF